MLTRALRLFHVRFTTVYCLAVLIFSSQTRLFCTVYRQYTCIYTINMWKGRGKSDRGYFLTCERVEEDSKQEQDARMTTVHLILHQPSKSAAAPVHLHLLL